MSESVLFTKKDILDIVAGRKVQHRIVVDPQPASFHKDLQHPALVIVQEQPLVTMERQDVARWWQYMGEATTHSADALSPLGATGSLFWNDPQISLGSICVERLQEMSRAAAFLEGCPTEIAGEDGDIRAAHEWFVDLWDRQNPKHQWGTNPWVWVYTFNKEQAATFSGRNDV